MTFVWTYNKCIQHLYKCVNLHQIIYVCHTHIRHIIYIRSMPSCARWTCIGGSLTNLPQHKVFSCYKSKSCKKCSRFNSIVFPIYYREATYEMDKSSIPNDSTPKTKPTNTYENLGIRSDPYSSENSGYIYYEFWHRGEINVFNEPTFNVQEYSHTYLLGEYSNDKFQCYPPNPMEWKIILYKFETLILLVQ